MDRKLKKINVSSYIYINKIKSDLSSLTSQKAILVDEWTQLFGQSFVGDLKRHKGNRDEVTAAITGFQGVAELISTDVGTIQLQLISDAMDVGMGKICLPQYASRIQHRLRLRRKAASTLSQCRESGHILYQKVRLKPLSRPHLRLGIGDEVVHDRPGAVVSLQAIGTSGQVRTRKKHPDETI